ncbi:MAG: hypothetical protein B5M56_08030 [Desulfococcus sp. 4484_241]|nr:MAG: hypothetical protein B5M56_08030 [Desulfococcus sp. 4484_241]
MKQYVIDELRPGEYERIREYLDNTVGRAEMGSIYWIPVPEEILSGKQRGHKNCKPFYFIADLEEARISCELLVRTKNSIRCDCIAYATPAQREWLINYIDNIFATLKITT